MKTPTLRQPKTAKIAKTAKMPKMPKMTVSESNLKRAAERLLPHNGRLVSTEIHYIQRVLGTSATQQALDEQVLAVRKLPWSSIVIPE